MKSKVPQDMREKHPWETISRDVYDREEEKRKEEKPYSEHFEVNRIMKYNPNFGDDRICNCGHPYYRHFDTYEAMSSVGCKYCQCFEFNEEPKLSRVWCMPNKDTFSIKPIRELIERYIDRERPNIIIDPFFGNSPFAAVCHMTNDLNPESKATHHMEAMDFLKKLDSNIADMVLFDPPWTVRQIQECYKNIGREVHKEDTQSSFYGDRKKEIARIVRRNGIAISCGYNSGGIGKTNGFSLMEVLIVPHGGAHHDSIVTVERKIE